MSELTSRADTHAWTIVHETPKLIEKMKCAVLAKQAMGQSKELAFKIQIPVLEDHLSGGGTIAALEDEHMNETARPLRLIEVRSCKKNLNLTDPNPKYSKP